MNALNRLQSVIIIVAVLLGLLIGQKAAFSQYAEHFIKPFLMLMLFGLFLNIPVKALWQGFAHLKFFSANLVINFVWTPLFAYALGGLLLQHEPSLWIGFVMLMVTPCTDWYLVFTDIAKGNTPLSTSILPLNLLLQLILLPVYLLLFFGETGTVDASLLLESIVLIIVVPFLLAQAVKFILQKCRQTVLLNDKLLPFFEKAQVIFLGLAIMAMFAAKGSHLLSNPEVVLILLAPLLLFFVVNFGVGRLAAKLLKLNYADSASLNLATLARNSPIALAIAITAFPNAPLVALALAISPLIELPVLALVVQVLLRISNQQA